MSAGAQLARSGAPVLPPPAQGSVDVLIVAGEHSGDEHAATLVGELQTLRPGLRLCAVGGPRLDAAGAQLLHDLTARSVVGLVEVLKHYGYFKALFNALVDWIATHRPRVVVLVDYPGFNLRLADALRRKGGLSRKGGGPVGVYGYIGPQLWAWKRHRRFAMAQNLDALGVIFPFEPDVYADTALPVRFVGHPFAHPSHQPLVRYADDAPLLLLPGSRLQPVRRIFPLLARAAQQLLQRKPGARFLSLYPSAALKDLLTDIAREHGLGAGQLELRPSGSPIEGRGVLTSSGTMSLSCALAGLPGVIVYRAHPLTYWIGRRVVRVPYLGIANLILGRTTYPEFLQGAADPEALAQELERMLGPEHADARARALSDAEALYTHLKAPADRSAAQEITGLLDA